MNLQSTELPLTLSPVSSPSAMKDARAVPWVSTVKARRHVMAAIRLIVWSFCYVTLITGSDQIELKMR
jgi:hypothetical protein